MGRYEVTGNREYRGHKTGTVFEARLDRHAETRAVRRGDISLLEHVQPGLSPGSYELPEGWSSATTDNKGPGRGLSS